MRIKKLLMAFVLVVIASLPLQTLIFAQERAVLSPDDALSIKHASNAKISPDGRHIAYLVHVPRKLEDKPGPMYSELHVRRISTSEDYPYVTGKVNVSSPQWSPDGESIGFMVKRGEKAKTQVWVIPFRGGEAYQITYSKTNVSYFHWHPDSKRIAYVATPTPSKLEKKLKEKGYEFIFFEENLKHRNLYMLEVKRNSKEEDALQLTKDVTVWSFEFSADGSSIAASISENNLIDQRYMFRKIFILDLETNKLKQLSNNPGKLGNFAFSPDGKSIAYTASRDRSDNAVSQLYVINASGGKARNLTPSEFKGHINWTGWKNKSTILYMADEGVNASLYTVRNDGSKRKRILSSIETECIFSPPSVTKNFKTFAFTCSSPSVPSDLYSWSPGKKLQRLTELNPWIAERKLGTQKVIHYKARDGQEIEGILVYPVDNEEGKQYPLIVTVHGGPESHYSNRWLTGYFQPAQVFAGEGYLVFLPNYRSSTGYGVDYAMTGYGEAAGTEFDDIADGIDYLVKEGLADKTRVGLGGGSYGGFAAAWFSSYYTEKVKAAVMFVGISDLISKRGTTDIPYEELFVHSGKKLEEMWEKSLKYSPIYWAHKSKTAVLILGGTADTRVHPSQSLEYYRRLKMNEHKAVRLVRYPGEGHGNRKHPGRADVLYRSLEWFNWYLKDNKPVEGTMPRLDISDKYGLKIPE